MEKKFDAVISGVSARIPECDNQFDFMEKIYNKVSMTSVDTKWMKGAEGVGVPYYSGRVKNVHSYDYNCFGLNSHQIRAQVPITIKLLEMAYEAIVDAAGPDDRKYRISKTELNKWKQDYGENENPSRSINQASIRMYVSDTCESSKPLRNK